MSVKIAVINNDAFVELIRDAEVIYYLVSQLKAIAQKQNLPVLPFTIGIQVNGGMEVFTVKRLEYNVLTVEYL